MQIRKLNTYIPLEPGDQVKIKGYANEYIIDDILVVYSIKNSSTIHILVLREICCGVDFDSIIRLPYEQFEWEIIKEVKTMRTNKENNQKRCPICGSVITGYPAISRKDNKTEICSSCGAAEAFEALRDSTH